MKKAIKLILLLTACAMLSAAAAPALAAEEFSYENEAEILHDLGLYSGISDTTFDPDLGSPLDRLTGMSLMLKIFGLWEEAEAMSDEDVEAALDYFEDKDRIPEWGRNVAAHVIVSELGQSFCPNGEFTADEMDAQSYYAVMLKALGYTVTDFKQAGSQLQEAGGLTAEQAEIFGDKDLIKDDAVGIAFGVLKARTADGKLLIQRLVDKGAVDKEKARFHFPCVAFDPEERAAEGAVNAYEDAPLLNLSDLIAAVKLRDVAQILVDELPDREFKDALQARIDAVNGELQDAANMWYSPPAT